MGRLPRELAWVACGGVVRRVRHGAVHCPRRGKVRVTTCLACPRLMATAAERDPETSCSLKAEPRPG